MKSEVFNTRSQRLYQKWWKLLAFRHFQACLTAIGRLSRTPIATFMTVAVIGISLALPMGLFLFLKNVEVLMEGWWTGTRISVFLKVDTRQHYIEQTIELLKKDHRIAQVDVITPEQAMREFQSVAGFEDVIKHLPENPFPTVLQIQPAVKVQSTEDLNILVTDLQSLPFVDIAQLDMEWVKRLALIIEVVQRAVQALAFLLGIGVILVIGNMIRLASEYYRNELEIAKLVGATNAFVRRPFLYTGAFYGIMGGVLAWLCLDFVVSWLRVPLHELALVYESDIKIHELDIFSVLALIGSGLFLGLIGAYFAVRHFLRLHEIEL